MSDAGEFNASAEAARPAAEHEVRLYVPHAEGWEARIKQGWEKDYCFSQNPGEDFFHVLVGGEIYLERGAEKYCLNCALRHGILSRDRLYWQRRPPRPDV